MRPPRLLRSALGGLVRRAARFRKAREGVSAVEFALLAPVLVTMLGGAIEFSGAITAANRSTYVADALAEMVSRVDHTVTDTELKNFAVAAALVNPDIVNYARESGVPIEQAFKVTISSVQFQPKDAVDGLLEGCVTKCGYKAKVVFSYTLNGTARACKGNLKPVDGAPKNEKQLPADAFGPGSLVVVDVETFYRPIMPIRLSEEMSFKRSSYFRPRYVARVNSDKNCSGF